MTLRTPVTRLRAPLVSAGYGKQARNWAAAVSTDFGVNWNPQSTSEVVGDEPQTVSRIKVFGFPPFDLDASDRLVGPDGLTYEVDGEVERSYHPRTGALHHVIAYLKRAAIPA